MNSDTPLLCLIIISVLFEATIFRPFNIINWARPLHCVLDSLQNRSAGTRGRSSNLLDWLDLGGHPVPPQVLRHRRGDDRGGPDPYDGLRDARTWQHLHLRPLSLPQLCLWGHQDAHHPKDTYSPRDCRCGPWNPSSHHYHYRNVAMRFL